MVLVWATVRDALNLMREFTIGSVLVRDGEKIVGIWTERDLTRDILVDGELVQNVPASFRQEGQEILEETDMGDGRWRVLVRKKQKEEHHDRDIQG